MRFREYIKRRPTSCITQDHSLIGCVTHYNFLYSRNDVMSRKFPQMSRSFMKCSRGNEGEVVSGAQTYPQPYNFMLHWYDQTYGSFREQESRNSPTSTNKNKQKTGGRRGREKSEEIKIQTSDFWMSA